MHSMMEEVPEQAEVLRGVNGCSWELSAEWAAAAAAAANRAERCCCCCAREPSVKAWRSSCNRRSSGLLPMLASARLPEPLAAACVASCQALTLCSSSCATDNVCTPSSPRLQVLAGCCGA